VENVKQKNNKFFDDFDRILEQKETKYLFGDLPCYVDFTLASICALVLLPPVLLFLFFLMFFFLFNFFPLFSLFDVVSPSHSLSPQQYGGKRLKNERGKFGPNLFSVECEKEIMRLRETRTGKYVLSLYEEWRDGKKEN